MFCLIQYNYIPGIVKLIQAKANLNVTGMKRIEIFNRLFEVILISIHVTQ